MVLKKKGLKSSTKMVDFDRQAEGIKTDEVMSSVIEKSMFTYGSMTVEDRAIPDYRDGFKKVHRRILWSMYQNKMWRSGAYRKAAKVIGDVIGNYHPHGDQAAYSSMVTMANFQNSLIDPMGNWGNFLGDPAAAQRYTECRLSSLAEQLVLDEYNMAIVETVPNFDSSTVEPVVFVPNIPLLLIYGSGGIAVATTTAIPSFTLESVTKLVRAAMARSIKKEEFVPLSAKDCVKILEFSHHTGGYVTSDTKELTEFFANPIGRVQWSCEWEWDEKGNYIAVTGFAPNWNITSKMRKFEALPQVKQVSSFNDKQRGKHIRIILKKMSTGETENVREQIEKEMVSAVTYRINLTERFTETKDGIIETKARFFSCSIPDMLNKWIKWRIKMHRRALNADLVRLNEKLRKEELLSRAIDILDEMVKMLRNKTAGFDKVKALMKLMSISEEEAKSIWAIAIGRFDKLSKADQLNKIKTLKQQIAGVKQDLEDPFLATYEYIKTATSKPAKAA